MEHNYWIDAVTYLDSLPLDKIVDWLASVNYPQAKRIIEREVALEAAKSFLKTETKDSETVKQMAKNYRLEQEKRAQELQKQKEADISAKQDQKNQVLVVNTIAKDCENLSSLLTELASFPELEIDQETADSVEKVLKHLSLGVNHLQQSQLFYSLCMLQTKISKLLLHIGSGKILALANGSAEPVSWKNITFNEKTDRDLQELVYLSPLKSQPKALAFLKAAWQSIVEAKEKRENCG